MIQSPPVTATKNYLDTAFSIGVHLAREAIWDGDTCNWLGSNVDAIDGKFKVVYKTFSLDLYNGTAGVAFFLSKLYQETADDIIYRTLEGCVNQMLKNYNHCDLTSNYGYYGGKLGVADAFIQIGRECKRADWEKAGWQKLDKICGQDIQTFEVDVISGIAGAIPVFLRLHDQSGKKKLLDTAIKCGNHLMQIAVKSDAYWHWQTLEGQKGLTGYSHGSAGIALALLELYKKTENPNYLSAALYGFAYERALYNPQVQNWPDLRELEGSVGTNAANHGETWCHGAPGIALSRIKAWQLTGEEVYKKEAEIALATTHRSVYAWLTNPNVPSNFSLCHGLAGNAECLLVGGQILGHEPYLQVAQEVANFGIEKYAKNKFVWPSGVNDPSGATAGMEETPGLMLGLAGTGYYYLRVSDPGRYPSVLLL